MYRQLNSTRTTDRINWHRPLALGRVFFLALIVALASRSAIAGTAADTYLAAQRAVSSGATKSVAAVKQQLGQFQSLLPFVEYKLLRRTFAQRPNEEIQAFIDRHPHAVVSMLARHKYLNRLADSGQWETFIDVIADLPYPVDLGTPRRCQFIQAQLATGTTLSELDSDIADVWHAGSSLPDSCDPVFKQWHQAGLMTPQRALDRVGLAVGKNKISLARYIARTYLDKTANSRVEDWINARQNPKAVLNKYADVLIPVNTVSLIQYAMTRVAWQDKDQAPAILDQWLPRMKLTNADRDRVIEDLGRRAAAWHKDYASELLDRVAPEHLREDTPERHITAALREGRVSRAAELISALPPDDYKSPRWQYWSARLAQQRGETQAANTIFKELATTRNYYGFLSADRLKQTYALNDARADDTQVDRLAAQPSFLMARALLDADDEHMARRQWAFATRELVSDGLQNAAVLAHRWDWHDRAIFTMAKSGFFNDMQVRFPVLYQNAIEKNATTNGLNPAWIFGVIRQESAFVHNARSSVGALGLMQLMPATGKRVAKRIGLKIRNNSTILKPENNIQLGSAYLRELIDQCGHPVLATASYNAGPRRARRWLPQGRSMDAELWIESIPYKETRGFVKNVLSFTAVYEQRLGRQHRRLSDKLAPIPIKAC